MSAANDPTSDNDRIRGFGLGTAILTASQLKEIHTRLNQAFKRLNDPTITYLLDSFACRLKAAGIEVDNQVPLRAFANRSIIDSIAKKRNSSPSIAKKPDPSLSSNKTLIHEEELEKVEKAILNRRPVLLSVPDLKKPEGKKEKVIRVWPLQILFHNIAWYLAYESMGMDHLLTVSRLDRIKLSRGSLPQQRTLLEMQQSQQRLELLCRRTGGIYLGDNHQQQAELAKETLSEAKIQQLLLKGTLTQVRFRCSPRVYAYIRSGSKRYPSEQMRLSGPLPTDTLKLEARGIEPLAPDPDNTTHPYPVELILPAWTVDSNDFKGWLFGFGDGIKIEAPEDLRQKHHAYGQGIVRLYDSPEADGESSSAAEGS